MLFSRIFWGNRYILVCVVTNLSKNKRVTAIFCKALLTDNSVHQFGQWLLFKMHTNIVENSESATIKIQVEQLLQEIILTRGKKRAIVSISWNVNMEEVYDHIYRIIYAFLSSQLQGLDLRKLFITLSWLKSSQKIETLDKNINTLYLPITVFNPSRQKSSMNITTISSNTPGEIFNQFQT